MVDEIPARVWLIIAIVIFAYRPARYVIEHILADPSRRDITLPKEDLSWRTTAQLTRSLIILSALLAFSIFIFTPQAERLAASPRFPALLMLTIGAWVLFSVGRALTTGEVELILRGFNATYERVSQPKKFWASLTWNALLGGFLIWFGFDLYADAPREALRDACFNHEKRQSPEERISVCTTLINDPESSSDDIEDYLSNRGIAYYLRGDFKRALKDYNEAIRREPNDDSTFYNRALVHQQQGNLPAAIADFSTAIRLDPQDMDPYLQRGITYLDIGRFNDAVLDFTLAHRLDPSSPWPLANRGLAYAWTGDRVRATQDFVAVRRMDPNNVVLLRGEALMAIQAKDFATAGEKLSAALAQNPNDEWSLRRRAYVYEHLGQDELRLDDLDRLWRLTGRRGEAVDAQ